MADTQLDWIPVYIDKLLASRRWSSMKDYQRGWYWQLLIESTRSERTGYIRLDADIWKVAGACSGQYWGASIRIGDHDQPRYAAVLACFSQVNIAGDIWIYNERMVRVLEEQTNKLLKKRRRKSDDSFSLSYSPDSLEVDLGIKPPNSDEVVERIWRKHPANWTVRGKSLTVPPAHAIVIIKHIAENGAQLVEDGTEHYAEAVRKWPQSEQTTRNIFSVTKFYDTYEYLKSMSRWERPGEKTNPRQANEDKVMEHLKAMEAKNNS